MDDIIENRGQALLDLYIDWQALIRRRSTFRPGTRDRNQLDVIYFRTLPVITSIADAVDEGETDRLVHLARSLIRDNN